MRKWGAGQVHLWPTLSPEPVNVSPVLATTDIRAAQCKPWCDVMVVPGLACVYRTWCNACKALYPKICKMMVRREA